MNCWIVLKHDVQLSCVLYSIFNSLLQTYYALGHESKLHYWLSLKESPFSVFTSAPAVSSILDNGLLCSHVFRCFLFWLNLNFRHSEDIRHCLFRKLFLCFCSRPYVFLLTVCICPISESANCKLFSFTLHISQIPLFSLLDNWRYKASLFTFTAAPSELKLKQGWEKLRQDKARLTSLRPHALHTCCKAWGFLLAVAILGYRVASTKMHEKHYAIEHSLLFILFSMVTVMSEHAVSYFLIYIWP